MQREPQHVHRRLEQFGIRTVRQYVESLVGGDEFAVRADDDRRIRQVASQDADQGFAYRAECGIVQVGLGEEWCEAGREQQRVPVAQGQPECLGQPDHDRAAGA
jgi:hypothetical protein